MPAPEPSAAAAANTRAIASEGLMRLARSVALKPGVTNRGRWIPIARAWHASCIIDCMSSTRGVPVGDLIKQSGVSFFTRRVLQRWLRGEISTDTAVELIQSDD